MDISDQYRKEAEELIKKDPSLLLGKIKTIVFKSYAYFGFLLFACIFVISAILFLIIHFEIFHVILLLLIIFAGNTFYIIAKSLFFKNTFEKPYLLIEPNDYPELFSVISDLESKLSVKIDEVYIDEVYNAAVTQYPRFGIFGNYKNVLLIGLPYLLFLSKDELRAVLAHEFAHISNNDGKKTGSVYRTRQSWSRMAYLMATAKRRFMSGPIIWYLNKTWPAIEAYTFAYSRMAEYRADDFAAKYTNVNIWSENIVKAYVGSYLIDDFYNQIAGVIDGATEPPKNIYKEMTDFLKKSVDQKKLEDWVKMSAFEYTRNHDTHPSLEDRLSAQGVDISLDSLYKLFSSKGGASAAEFYLDKNYQKVIDKFNEKRFNHLSEIWQDHLNKKKELDNALQALDEGPEEKVWERIEVLIQKDGLLSVEKNIDELIEKDENDAKALFYKSVILLERNDPAGEVSMKKLVEDKKVSYQEAGNFLYKYYSKNNMRDEGRALEALLQKEFDETSVLNSALNDLSQKDVLVEHDLSKEIVDKVLEFANKNSKDIKNIHIAKKIIPNNDKDVYVISIKLNDFFAMQANTSGQKLINELVETLPIVFVAFIWHWNNTLSKYGTKVRKVSNSLVYGRETFLE